MPITMNGGKSGTNFFGQSPSIAHLNRLTGDLVVRNTKRDPQFLIVLAKQRSCFELFHS